MIKLMGKTINPINVTYNGEQIKQLSYNGNVVWDKSLVLYNYIEATGTQYIDTGLILDNIHRYEFEMHWSFSNTTSTENGLYWYREGNGGNFASVMCVPTSNGIRFANYSSGSTGVAVQVTGNDIYCSTNKDKITVNGNTSNLSNYPSNIYDSSWNTPFYLFYIKIEKSANVAEKPLKARLYYMKIKDDQGNIIRDFVPCTFKGKAGLYDKVNEKFYDNKGTEEFIIG